MKLVAAMIVKNELSRYLELSIASLLEFCDEVCAIDDFSDDGTYEWLFDQGEVSVMTNPAVTFDEHEGKARQALLDLVRESNPTHVLAIDADEFVDDGPIFRRTLEQDHHSSVWTLVMEEVWEADERWLRTRQDGGWRQHPVPVAWRAPSALEDRSTWWTIKDQALACGREPVAVREFRGVSVSSGASILHFGWTNLSERQRRYDRYMAIDGGAFHASTHLRSIMHRRPRLASRSWPMTMNRTEMLARVREDRA